jgi:membrane protease YdiL (CAAX protease family)
MPRLATVLTVAGLVCFGAFYSFQVSFPGYNYRSYVLLAGLAGGLTASVLLRWEPHEILVIGLTFAVPMADQLVFSRTLLARMGESLLFYVLIPLSLLWVLRRGHIFSDLGIGLGDRRTTLWVTTALLGAAAAMSVAGLMFPEMTRYYPIWDYGLDVTVAEFAYNELIISGIMFAGEFFYRGLILFTLAKRSRWGAIVFQSLPYAYLHVGKPAVEVPYSLVAGIVFGWANLRSRSLLPSWITHSVGSALFDALVIIF